MPKILTCPVCQTVKVVQRKNATCSRRCGQAWARQQQPNRYCDQRAAAARLAVPRRREVSIDRWARMFPGIPIIAIRRMYTAGYHAGIAVGQRRGFRDGQHAAEAAIRMKADIVQFRTKAS